MIREALMWLLGMTFLATLCNTPTWVRLNLMTAGQPLSIRLGRRALLLTNTGLLVGCWVRLSQAYNDPDAAIRPVPVSFPYIWNHSFGPEVLGISLILLLLGEVTMLLSGAEALRVAGKSRWGFWAFVLLAPVASILAWRMA